MNEDGKFEVTYKEDNYNIYAFLNNHPGGINYVKPYEQKDVTRQMKEHDHSKAAYYLLKEYRDGGRDSHQNEEDLEHLVDWDKPMLSQVASLGTKYKDWVSSPVDRHLRLFCNPILENLTITPWYVVPLVWIPVIIYFISTGTQKYIQITKDPAPVISSVLYISLGVLLWTLVEYSLHRWVFHMEPSGHSKIMIYLHFAIHGLHHKPISSCLALVASKWKTSFHFVCTLKLCFGKESFGKQSFLFTVTVPFDARRLVFPPFPAAIIAYLLYKIISLIFHDSTRILVMAGGLAGYVTYDMIHFYLHHGAPKENTYLYHLKRYHNQHHFAHQDNGFGISSMFWDKIFGTAICLRKLNLGIKW